MVKTELMEVNNHLIQGISIQVPSGETHPDMLMMHCKKGYIMCGYLNISTAEAEGDVAAVISGDDFEAMIQNPVKAVTSAAEELGITIGMSGMQVIEKLNQ